MIDNNKHIFAGPAITAYSPSDTKGILNVTDQVRVNIAAKVNASSIRYETRNGRDVIIVPSATLPDNIVMNGIRYPATEIEKSYKSLSNTLAPLNHPMKDGEFVSAQDPAGLAGYYIGAHNENVRRENGRVYLDKVIDVEKATKLAPELINAINEGTPIHTSTGLLCNMDEGDDEAEYTATNMVFDHDAILLNDVGAATPEQGVGMLVNKAQHNGKKIDVINSEYVEAAERDIDYYGTELMRAIDRKEAVSRWGQIKSAVMEALGLERETQTNSNEVQKMTEVTKEQFDELSAKVNAVSEAIEKLDIATVVANAVKPLTDKMAEDANAKRAELINKVVAAGILTEEEAEGAPEALLNKLASTAPAATLNAAPGDTSDDDYASPLEIK